METGNTPAGSPSPDVEGLRELLAQATPGPWVHYGSAIWQEGASNAYVCGLTSPRGTQQRDDDAKLIVAMRAELPALLAIAEENGRLRADLAEIAGATDGYADYADRRIADAVRDNLALAGRFDAERARAEKAEAEATELKAQLDALAFADARVARVVAAEAEAAALRGALERIDEWKPNGFDPPAVAFAVFARELARSALNPTRGK